MPGIDDFLGGLTSYGQQLGAGDFDVFGLDQFGDDEMRPDPETGEMVPLSELAKRYPAKYSFKRTAAPQLYSRLGAHLEELARQGAGEQYQATIEGLAGAEREQNRAFGEQASDIGLDPYTAQLQREQRGPAFEQQAATARGQIQAGLTGQLGEIAAGTTDAIQKSVDYQRSIDLQRFLAAKARSSARDESKSAQQTALIGAGIGAAGAFLGGPAFGAAGLVGGQAGGQPRVDTPFIGSPFEGQDFGSYFDPQAFRKAFQSAYAK